MNNIDYHSRLLARTLTLGLAACATIKPSPSAEIQGLPLWARMCVKSYRAVHELLDAADAALVKDDCATAQSTRVQIEKLFVCAKMNCAPAWEEYKGGELSNEQVDIIGAIGEDVRRHWTKTRDAIGTKCAW